MDLVNFITNNEIIQYIVLINLRIRDIDFLHAIYIGDVVRVEVDEGRCRTC